MKRAVKDSKGQSKGRGRDSGDELKWMRESDEFKRYKSGCAKERGSDKDKSRGLHWLTPAHFPESAGAKQLWGDTGSALGCTASFSVTVIKYHDQKQQGRKGLIWRMVESIGAGKKCRGSRSRKRKERKKDLSLVISFLQQGSAS